MQEKSSEDQRAEERIWRLTLARLLSVRNAIGMIAVGHGFIRLQVGLPTIAISFGTNVIFGSLLLFFGLAVLMTKSRRLHLVGRLTAVGLAITYGTLGFSLLKASPASAWADAVFVAALLAEAGAYE